MVTVTVTVTVTAMVTAIVTTAGELLVLHSILV